MDPREQMKAFGMRIRALRVDARLTQAALAEQIEISTVYMNKLERGLAMPSISVLCRLGDRLKSDVASLFTPEVMEGKSNSANPYLDLFLVATNAQERRLAYEQDGDDIPLPPGKI